MESGELARNVVSRLKASGHQAYLVGGCVRDVLLGRTPEDWDVATDARPDRIAELFERSELVGAHFGVVLVRQEVAQVEVATFRSDRSYSDGRRPDSVHFETDPRQDALRRDFTINALFLDPASEEVLDFVGGRADIEARVVRAIGDPEARFGEDHLRLLRAVRFAARLGFEIEERTRAAIRKLAPAIHKVSAERVRDELLHILTEGGARRGFEMLDETGLLRQVLPEIAAMKGVDQPPEYHPEGDVWTHTLLMLERLGRPTPTLALGALLHDVGKPPTFQVAERIRFDGHVEKGMEMARDILSRLRLSSDQIAQVEALVSNHMRFKDVHRMKDSTLKRFLRMSGFEEHLELHKLDCLASNGNLESYQFVRDRRAHLPEEELRPKPLLNGRDLIAAGFRPGPALGRILRALEDAQLEGRLSSREEAMEWLRARYTPPDGEPPAAQ